MRNETRRRASAISAGDLFNVLLLFVNSVGIVGALADILEISWNHDGTPGKTDGVEGTIFWAGLFLFCLIIGIIQGKGSRKKRTVGFLLCAAVYLFCGLAFWKELLEGLIWLLRDAVKNLNQLYSFHIPWKSGTWLREALRWGQRARMWCTTLSGLYLFVFPLLLTGFSGRFGRALCLLAGNALWFAAACICDRFPGGFYLVFCVAGGVSVFIQREFEEKPGLGLWAAVCGTALTGIAVGISFRFFLPVLNERYEDMEEGRARFYILVNEEWIPALRGTFSGFGGGVDVTGELYRKNVFSYTSSPAYRVTVDSIPQGTLYLKGFVGEVYSEKEWKRGPESALADYYRENGLELPEDYGDLVNIGHEAGRTLCGEGSSGYIGIEELGGRGTYSLYPYGAQIPDEFQVYADGSVARERAEYGFSYFYLSGFRGNGILSGEWEEREAQYSRYVHDKFLEYDQGRLPRLTERLAREDIRTDNVYNCALDIMKFLDRQAEYDLDAENNPSDTDFVEYFLFDSHKGYCMHFASAAVLSFRYFGIPARYAAGYSVSPSAFSRESEGVYSAVLTGKEAHAWAEIYLDKIGWVPVEMTPGAVALAEDGRMEQLAHVGQLSGQGLMLQDSADRWGRDRTAWPDAGRTEEEPSTAPTKAPASDRERADGQLSSGENRILADGRPNGTGDSSGEEICGEKETGPWGGLFLLAAAVGIGLTVLVRLSAVRRRRRAEIFCQAGTREKIYLLYRNLRRALQYAGCPAELAADEAVFRRRLAEISRKLDGEDYEAFCAVLEKNSFSLKEPSREELMRVHEIHDLLVREIYEKAPFYKKILIGRHRDMCRGGTENVCC